jgi:DNA polymerase
MSFQFDLFGDPFNRIFAATDYGSFKTMLQESDCRKCALGAGRTSIVVDRGRPETGIVAIGEGPGEHEDREGRAFVGRAGKLLDQIMKQVGLDTEEHLLIANVIKCRPPQNRAPSKEEAQTCLPFLKKQISLIRPHTILLLGAVAVRHLLREKQVISMQNEVGQFFTSLEYPGVEFVALYHPAFLLRDPRRKPETIKHLEKIREHLKTAGRWPVKSVSRNQRNRGKESQNA